MGTFELQERCSDKSHDDKALKRAPWHLSDVLTHFNKIIVIHVHLISVIMLEMLLYRKSMPTSTNLVLFGYFELQNRHADKSHDRNALDQV